jgi:hypothetical protein
MKVLYNLFKGTLYMLPEDSSSSLIITESKDSLPGPPRKYISADKEAFKNWPLIIADKYQMLVACNLPWIGKENNWYRVHSY